MADRAGFVIITVLVFLVFAYFTVWSFAAGSWMVKNTPDLPASAESIQNLLDRLNENRDVYFHHPKNPKTTHVFNSNLFAPLFLRNVIKRGRASDEFQLNGEIYGFDDLIQIPENKRNLLPLNGGFYG